MNVLISNYTNQLLTVCLDFEFAELLSSILWAKEGWMGRNLWEFCRNFLYDVPFVRKTWRRNARRRTRWAFSLLLIHWHSETFSLSSILFTLLHPNHGEKSRLFYEKIIMENARKHFVCMSLGMRVYFEGVA